LKFRFWPESDSTRFEGVQAKYSLAIKASHEHDNSIGFTAELTATEFTIA
jgi:hypothetical protein